MIPRIIHFSWLGHGPRPSSVERCIATWRRYLPSYQIMEWNEENFDIHSSPYVEEAYNRRKYAFVSDVIRGRALYDHGGIYLDTDVEVLKSFDPLLQYRSFWGFEAGNFVATSTIGAEKGHELIKAYLDRYANRYFLLPDGSCDVTTNVTVVTNLLRERGLNLDNSRQLIGNNNVIFPQSWFSPYDYRIGKLHNLSDAYAIHHFAVTWSSPMARSISAAKRYASGIPGASNLISFLHSMMGRK